MRKSIGSEVKWAECSLIIGTGCWVFSLILDSSVGLWVGIQSAGELVSETSQLRILHSAEEDNLSPFDSKIPCLCKSIESNNSKRVCTLIKIVQQRETLCSKPWPYVISHELFSVLQPCWTVYHYTTFVHNAHLLYRHTIVLCII